VVTVMMAETIRSPQHRAKAVGTVQSSWSFGWGAAAILYWAFFALLPEDTAWRACFWIGILPALWILYIRRNVSDPEIYLATRRARDAGTETATFADIFKGNALKNSLLPIVVPQKIHDKLFALPEKARIKVDLASQTITLPDGERVEFPVDPFSKTCLLEGIDELGWILKQQSAIAAFEAGRVGSIDTVANA